MYTSYIIYLYIYIYIYIHMCLDGIYIYMGMQIEQGVVSMQYNLNIRI